MGAVGGAGAGGGGAGQGATVGSSGSGGPTRSGGGTSGSAASGVRQIGSAAAAARRGLPLSAAGLVHAAVHGDATYCGPYSGAIYATRGPSASRNGGAAQVPQGEAAVWAGPSCAGLSCAGPGCDAAPSRARSAARGGRGACWGAGDARRGWAVVVVAAATRGGPEARGGGTRKGAAGGGRGVGGGYTRREGPRPPWPRLALPGDPSPRILAG